MIYIDNEEVAFETGPRLIDLLGTKEATGIRAGELAIRKADGTRVAPDEEAEDGATYFTVLADARPPSVDSCLNKLRIDIPRDFALYLVRSVIDEIREDKGVASSKYVVYRVGKIAEASDAASVMGYLTDGKYGCRAFEEVGPQAFAGLLPGGTGVIAVRDVITMQSGEPVTELFVTGNLDEVGTTNKVRLDDYFKEKYDVLVSAKAEHFGIKGFTAQPEYTELFGRCREAGVASVMVLDGFSLLSELFAEIVSAAPDYIVAAQPPELDGKSALFNLLGVGEELTVKGIDGGAVWETVFEADKK
ncbi:MAG: hypothetical protein GY771_02930 [bacterium]|nr:hypothetical protein [bacterium]